MLGFCVCFHIFHLIPLSVKSQGLAGGRNKTKTPKLAGRRKENRGYGDLVVPRLGNRSLPHHHILMRDLWEPHRSITDVIACHVVLRLDEDRPELVSGHPCDNLRLG